MNNILNHDELGPGDPQEVRIEVTVKFAWTEFTNTAEGAMELIDQVNDDAVDAKHHLIGFAVDAWLELSHFEGSETYPRPPTFVIVDKKIEIVP